jgi:hypothetical protein
MCSGADTRAKGKVCEALSKCLEHNGYLGKTMVVIYMKLEILHFEAYWTSKTVLSPRLILLPYKKRREDLQH